VRLFVAVDLPEQARREVARGLAVLRAGLPPARWVRPEGVHLTLKFLGEREEALVEALDSALAPRLAALAPAPVALGGGGFFPRAERARVAWLGGAADPLGAWAQAVDEGAATLGVERESRPFSLHLTLARLERPWSRPTAERFLEEVGAWRIEPFVAREATLFRSELGVGGARYTALRRWPVGEA
jgi:2'-5' RNA ligase